MDSAVLEQLTKKIEVKQQKIVAEEPTTLPSRFQHIQKYETALKESEAFLEQLDELRAKVIKYNKTLWNKIKSAKKVARTHKMITDF